MASLVTITVASGTGSEVITTTTITATTNNSNGISEHNGGKCNMTPPSTNNISNMNNTTNMNNYKISGPASPTTIIVSPSSDQSSNEEVDVRGGETQVNNNGNNITSQHSLQRKQSQGNSGKENDVMLYYTPTRKNSNMKKLPNDSDSNEASPTSIINKHLNLRTVTINPTTAAALPSFNTNNNNSIACERTEGFPKSQETGGRNDYEKTNNNSPILNNLLLTQSNIENLMSFDLTRPDGELIPNSFTNALEAFINSMQQLLPDEKEKVANIEALIQFLISVFKRYESNHPKILIFVLRAFSELAYSTNAPNHQYFNDEIFQHVISIMKAHSKLAELQKWGCIALRCFARHAKNTIGIAKLGGISQIMESMGLHIENTFIQVEAFKALFNLAFNSNNQKDIVNNGGLSLILKVFQCHQNVREVNEFGCNLLHNLAFKNLTNKQAIAAQGCIEIILDAMKSHLNAPKVQIEACRALMSLAFAGECQDKIAQLDGIATIFSAMRHLPNHKEVQTESCKVLCTLALNHMDNKVIIAKDVDLIIQAMKTHIESAELLAEGCAVLATLSFRSPKNKLKISKYGGIKIILEALKAHTKNEEVQIDGCKALASLAFDTSLQKIIASFGGIEVIINAMIQHPNKCQVQAEGCKALSELAYRCTENKQLITDSHGPTLIVEAMVKHETSNRVQLEGCRALFSQAIRQSCKVVIIESGAVLAVLNAMKMHENDSPIQDHGCRLLTELMYQNDDVKNTVLQNEGIRSILNAILNHGVGNKFISQNTSNGNCSSHEDTSAASTSASPDFNLVSINHNNYSTSAETSNLPSIEERARKALKYFHPCDIFDSVCQLFQNAKTEADVRRTLRLYFLIPYNTNLNFDTAYDDKCTLLPRSGSSDSSSSSYGELNNNDSTPINGFATAGDDGRDTNTMMQSNGDSQKPYTIICLTMDHITSWKNRVLKIAKAKRKENADIWTKDIAKKFGQLLKLIKCLLKNVRISRENSCR
jgi:hypothetical protein